MTRTSRKKTASDQSGKPGIDSSAPISPQGGADDPDPAAVGTARPDREGGEQLQHADDEDDPPPRAEVAEDVRSSSMKKLALSIAAMPQMQFSTPAMRIMIPANTTHPAPCVVSFTAASFDRPAVTRIFRPSEGRRNEALLRIAEAIAEPPKGSWPPFSYVHPILMMRWGSASRLVEAHSHGRPDPVA